MLGNLVKVSNVCLQDKPFGYIVGKNDSGYLVQYIDNGELFVHEEGLLVKYKEEDALLEMMYELDQEDYNCYRALEINIDKVQIDGYDIEKKMAIELAKEILDFYQE